MASAKRKPEFTTFFEGTKHTMDIAVHPDGSVYLATRNEILRLKDTKGTGKADVKERIAFLDTKGDYPHNGLSGLCFDSQGNLYFGMGENLGASYKMIGSDGTTISGEGDGGHIFWCTADGKKLRKVATGFWNPFGICRDIYGRMFAVDNDPDAMPPCRLLHVVEGGDYGFQFRYGRSGRHPFQAWNGELPGHAADDQRHRRGPVRGAQLRIGQSAGGVSRQLVGHAPGPIIAWNATASRRRGRRSRPSASRSSKAARIFARSAWRWPRMARSSSATGCEGITTCTARGRSGTFGPRTACGSAASDRRIRSRHWTAFIGRCVSGRPQSWRKTRAVEEYLQKCLTLREGLEQARMKDPRPAAA